MTRAEILEKAKEIVTKDREDIYGKPEDNFQLIGNLWEAYKVARDGYIVPFRKQDVAVMMILMKVARIATGKPKADNWIDICGYSSCGGEIETEQETPFVPPTEASVRKGIDILKEIFTGDDCDNCKHCEKMSDEEPCANCSDDSDAFEEYHSCENCKHDEKAEWEEPCRYCSRCYPDLWERR